MGGDVWVRIGGQRCRASELPYGLRVKLGISDEELRKETKREPVEGKFRETKVRESKPKRERIYVPSVRREYHKSPDSDMDIVMKFIGRKLGRAWVKLIK